MVSEGTGHTETFYGEGAGQRNESNRDAEDLENIWTGLKDCLLQATEEVCGRTKGLTRHTATWW